MSEIVKRLREEQRSQEERQGEEDADSRAELAKLAADEIERLRHDLTEAMSNHVADLNP
jgi:hypothetical protein